MTTSRKPDPDAWVFDSAEAMWVLRVASYKTLLKMIAAGLPAKNIGTPKRAQYLFLKTDIEEWLQEDRIKARSILAEMSLTNAQR